MKKEGLLLVAAGGDDGRQRVVRLSSQGEALLPHLQTCWQATKCAADSLDAELAFPLAELVLVGMAEEMMFRGVLFGVTARALGSKAAIVISSLVFALAHLPNAGFSLLAITGLVAYGVLQAALYMQTRRLCVCIGTHVGWNYCVGQVFSSTVSGHAATDGLLRGELAGNAMLTAGAFGVEASLVTVLLISVAAVHVLRLGFASAARTPRN